jgi:hypothetical protein
MLDIEPMNPQLPAVAENAAMVSNVTVATALAVVFSVFGRLPVSVGAVWPVRGADRPPCAVGCIC